MQTTKVPQAAPAGLVAGASSKAGLPASPPAPMILPVGLQPCPTSAPTPYPVGLRPCAPSAPMTQTPPWQQHVPQVKQPENVQQAVDKQQGTDQDQPGFVKEAVDDQQGTDKEQPVDYLDSQFII